MVSLSQIIVLKIANDAECQLTIMPILRLFVEMKGRNLGLLYKMLWLRMHSRCAKEVCFTPISKSTLKHYMLR
jgi:hypothetical protein